MKYLDFDLIIERSGDGYTARVFNSPAGQATAAFREPFSDLEIENFLLRVGRSRHAVRRIESPEMASAKAFGGKLFNEVFAGDVRGCLRSSIDEAVRQGFGLRVRLHLGQVPTLADLPWEFLYNAGMNRFLGLSVETPVVRYLELPERIRPVAVKPPLRVLMMISSPTDYAQLDVVREFAKMNEALSDLEQRGLVTVERLENATLSELQRRLRQNEYHIFHFVGHGGFDEQADDGQLVLEDAEERGRRVSAQFIGTLLHDHRPLRLAVLNACEGARASRADPFAGTAQALVQQGVPAVIAMQFEVTDEAAICFTREFYAALAAGYPVDAALAEARKAIFAEVSEIEWGTPVLYMRAPDGCIFEVEQVSEPDRKQLQLSSLLAAARTAEAAGDVQLAIDKLNQLLGLDPTHAEAGARLRDISRQRQLANMYTAARAAYDEGRWREAVDVLKKIVAIDRTYKDVDALFGLAEKALARANEEDTRRRRAGELRRAATSAMDKERWDEAVEHWQTLAALEPENETVRTRLGEARRQHEISALYLSARAHYDKRNWREALVELEQLQKTAPDYKEVPALLANIDRVLNRVPSIGTAAAKLQSLRGADPQAANSPPQAAAPRPVVQPPPPSPVVPRAKWFVLGSALGGIGVLVIALVIIGIVIVAMKDGNDQGSSVTPPSGVEKEVPRQPLVKETAPPRSQPSAPPAATTPPVSIDPARMVTAPAGTQTELANAVASGSQAEILAYRLANAQPLRGVYTGRLLALHEQQLQQLAAAGMTAAISLSNRQFRSFRISGDGTRAEVDMTERWSSNFMLGLLCVNHIHDHDVPQTVFLERQGRGWLAYDTSQNESEPELVPCHN
jgi:tetratricopeptide (TPR) repeat protein